MAQQTKTDQYKCSICGRSFDSEQQLREHTRTQHAEVGQQQGQRPGQSSPQR